MADAKNFGVWIRQWNDLAPSLSTVDYAPSTTIVSDDLLLNGNFAQHLAHWQSSGALPATLAAVTPSGYKGEYHLQISYTGVGKVVQCIDGTPADSKGIHASAALRYVRVQPGDTLRMTAAAFDSASVPGVGLDTYDDQFAFLGNVNVLGWSSVTGTWIEKDGTVVLGGGVYYVVPALTGGGGGSRVALFDEVHLWHRA